MQTEQQVIKKINPEETFNRVVSWIKNRAVKDKMPGIIVGVSGTDSLVVFLAAHEAFKQLGKAEAVTAVNFIHPASNQAPEDGKIACVGDLEKDWFANEIVPWLKEVAPDANYVIDDTIPFSDDNKRWGNIFSRAISDTQLNHGMLGNYSLVAGTRNRTEAVLGTYTLLSRAPSLQPIEHLYKTEILDICDFLQVPQIAIDKSREIDCDCGRFDIQANYLDELDLFIMTQQGDLDTSVLEAIDPDILNAIRSFYIEERENNAFREKVPYRPTPTKTVYQGKDIATAMEEIQSDDTDPNAISIVTPRIIIDRDADNAHKLVTSQSNNRPSWLAEAFTLLGTDGLSPEQIGKMTASVYGEKANKLNDEQAQYLAKIAGHIGQYGFSFPAKRFTTQRFADGPSLIERAGFKRHERVTDVRDESIPKSNPQRDEFGIGYTWINDNWYIEQRRAYLMFSQLSSDKPVTLLIRNSSPFFGRDRMAHAAYVSFDRKDPNQLLSLTSEEIENPDIFAPFENILNSDPVPLNERFNRVAQALDVLDNVDWKFSQWLRSYKGSVRFKSQHTDLGEIFNDEGGFTHLREFLKDALIKHVSAEKAGSPFYMAQLDPEHVAPWQPHRISSVTTDTLAQLKAAQERGATIQDDKLRALFTPLKQRQLVLMSGQHGDFPVRLEV